MSTTQYRTIKIGYNSLIKNVLNTIIAFSNATQKLANCMFNIIIILFLNVIYIVFKVMKSINYIFVVV